MMWQTKSEVPLIDWERLSLSEDRKTRAVQTLQSWIRSNIPHRTKESYSATEDIDSEAGKPIVRVTATVDGKTYSSVSGLLEWKAPVL